MTTFEPACRTEHNTACANCRRTIWCPECSGGREDTRGRGPGYCRVCLSQSPPEPSPGPIPTAALVDTRQILTTEGAFVARGDVLVRYLQGMCVEEFVRPVVLMETYWVQEVLRAELDRRRGAPSRLQGLGSALNRVETVPFCLLEGNHRSLAASLLDRHVNAVVIATPGELDAWRRHDGQFPHETEQDLRELGRHWVDATFGSIEQAAFDTDPLTVFERAALIESAGRLPSEAREILDEVRGSG